MVLVDQNSCVALLQAEKIMKYMAEVQGVIRAQSAGGVFWVYTPVLSECTTTTFITGKVF